MPGRVLNSPHLPMLQSYVQHNGIWHSEFKSLSYPLRCFWDVASIHEVHIIARHRKGSTHNVFVQILCQVIRLGQKILCQSGEK